MTHFVSDKLQMRSSSHLLNVDKIYECKHFFLILNLKTLLSYHLNVLRLFISAQNTLLFSSLASQFSRFLRQ